MFPSCGLILIYAILFCGLPHNLPRVGSGGKKCTNKNTWNSKRFPKKPPLAELTEGDHPLPEGLLREAGKARAGPAGPGEAERKEGKLSQGSGGAHMERKKGGQRL